MIKEITRYSECAADWENELKQVATHEQLLNLCIKYGELAEDAFRVVERMDKSSFMILGSSKNVSFDEFITGYHVGLANMIPVNENDWHRKYDSIICPDVLITVGLVALKAGDKGIPWGMAYNLMQEKGTIKCSIPYRDSEV